MHTLKSKSITKSIFHVIVMRKQKLSIANDTISLPVL